MPSSVARYHDPNAEAKLLLGFVAVALVAGTGYVCYSRLHVRKEQLMEASLYILAWSFVFWDVLRYVLTAPAEKENAWPHPPLRISRKARRPGTAESVRGRLYRDRLRHSPETSTLAGRSTRHAGQRLSA